MQLILIRDMYLSSCTLGTLQVPGTLGVFQTMERTWVASDVCRGGLSGVSCIPEGTYKLVRHDSPKHPMTWALVNDELDVCHNPTPGKRSDVLIHPANYAHELEGCIAPGTGRMLTNNEWMVLSSRAAFLAIKAALPYTDDHTIVIERGT